MRERLNPRIPFRVRIHGGDSGVSARATHHDVQKDTLMTNEKDLFAQADPEIVSGSTTERKKMSTKTSFKRIALVAVASLGLGVLTSVSAFAATTEATTITASSATLGGTATAATATGAVGTPVTFTTTITTTAPVAADTVILTPVLTGTAVANAASAVTVASTKTTVTPTTTTTNATFGTPNATTGAVTATLTAVAGAPTVVYGFTPDVAGTYLYTINVTGTATTHTNAAITFTYTATSAGPIFLTTGNTPAPVAASVTSGSNLTAVVGGFAKFTLAQGSTNTLYNITATGMSISGASTQLNRTVDTTQLYTNLNGVSVGGGVQWAPASIAGYITITVTSATAGTGTLTVAPVDALGVPGTAVTGTVTWGSAIAVSATNSKAYIEKTTNSVTAVTTDSSDILLSKATSNGDDQASIWVTLKDQNNNALTGQKLTVTLDGPGLIAVEQNQDGILTAMSSRTWSDAAANNGNTWQIGIAPDGTAGKVNVTISVGTAVVAVKSLTWYGAIAKLSASSVLIATANGSATTDAVVVCALDASGNAVPGASIYASSADTAVASIEATDTTVSGTAVAEDVDTGSAGTALVPTAYQAAKAIGCAGFTVTGASQTLKDSVVLTFRDASTAADATATTTVTQKVGSVTASAVTVAFDKASYAAGSKATVTLTFKDSVGRLVGAGAGTATLDAALTSSAALQGAALFATANNTKQGIATADVYVPWNAGTVTVTGLTGQGSGSGSAATLASAAKGVALTASATVTAAADSTSAQIASLISKINALSKLIAKIQKKLGIK